MASLAIDSCPAVEHLFQFVAGDVAESLAAGIRQHVDRCEDCRMLLAAASDEMGGEPPAEARAEVLGPPGIILSEEIGRGAQGRVYAGRDASGADVAVKLLTDGLAGDANAVARFERECALAQKLKSAHVARVHAFGRLANGTRYCVMDRLHGETLKRYAEDRVLDWRDAVNLIAQACDALGEAHGLGIVHRDVKLENLFLERGGDGAPRVRVLDFGLAKAHPAQSSGTTSLTSADDILGTARYMAPEQMISTRDVDARADVWALGVCLYKLVTGAFPFDAPSAMGLAARIHGREHVAANVVNPDVPAALSELIARCLAKNVDDRPADARALGLALVAPSAPVSAPNVADAHVSPARRRLAFAVGAAALLVGCVVAVAMALRAPRAEQSAAPPVASVASSPAVPVTSEVSAAPPLATVSAARARAPSAPSADGNAARLRRPPKSREAAPAPSAPASARYYLDM